MLILSTLSTIHDMLIVSCICRGHDHMMTLVILIKQGLLLRMLVSTKLFLSDSLINLVVLEKIRDASIHVLML